MLTDKKIEIAINSFSIACMNNVKWKMLCTQLLDLFFSETIKVFAKPVWSERIRRFIYRQDQITDKGISDPGIFGNDREEYKQIEYINITYTKRDLEAINSFKEWCHQYNIGVNETENELTIYGYKP